MKLHLNLALRRAVLAAMATMAVYTTQAEETATFPGAMSNGQYLVKGEGLETSASYNNSSEDLFIGGGEGGNANLTMTGSASITANTVNVGNSHNAVEGALILESGTGVTTNQLNVGCYAGQGSLTINEGASVEVKDSLIMGHRVNTLESMDLNDIHVAGGALTVGSADTDVSAIGDQNSTGSLNITNGGETSFTGTTIVGNKGSADGTINVGTPEESPDTENTLNLGALTVLGNETGATGTINIYNGTVNIGDKSEDDLLVIGNKGTGVVNVQGGTLDAGQGTILLGAEEGANAQGDASVPNLLLESGTVIAQNLLIGGEGLGYVKVDNAVLDVSDIVIDGTGTKWSVLELEAEAQVGKRTDESRKIDNLFIGGDDSHGQLTNYAAITVGNTIIGHNGFAEIKEGGLLTTDYLLVDSGNDFAQGLYIGADDDSKGSVTVNGAFVTTADSRVNVNTGGTLTTAGGTTPTDNGGTQETMVAGTITIAEGGTWNANGSTTGLGTITNNGTLNVGGSMSALQGITGTGSLAVAKDSRLALAGATTQGAISNNGDITIGAQTTAGAITNDGDITIGAQTTAGAITNDGDITIGAQTTTGAITNNGDITVSGAGRVDAYSLGGTGTTTITIDASTVATSDGLAIVELDKELTSAIKVDIDTANASALVGKGFDFVKVGDNLMSVGQDNFSVDEGWTINWDDKTITTGDASKGLQITYTGDDSGMVFNKLGAVEAKQIEVELPANVTIELEVVTETVLTATVTPEQMGTTVVVPETEEEKEAATDVVVENDTVIHAAEITTGVNEETHEDIRTNVVIGKDVESSGSGSTKVQSVVVNQKTTIDDGSSSTTIKENIGASGVALMLDGKTDHKGKGKAQGSELGFNEGIKEGSLFVHHADTNQTIKNEVKKIDIVQVGKDSDVSVSDMSMHSTHALTIGEGTTIEFNGVDLHVGGTTDVNLTQEVEVKVYDENGEWTGETKIETVDSGAHLTVDSTITKATVKISGESVVKFEKIDDDDHHSFGSTTFAESEVEIDKGSTLGDNSIAEGATETHMQTIKFDEKSKVTNRGDVKNAEFHHGSELKNDGGRVEGVVFEDGSKLKGTGHVKDVHVKKGSKLTVGSSPGVMNASKLTVDGDVEFYVVTNSSEWDTYTGNSSDLTTEYGKGSISQLYVDGSVTLNGTVSIVYQEQLADGTYADCDDQYAAREYMRDNFMKAFTEGDGIQFITGNTDQITFGSDFNLDTTTLPELEDGMFWDLSELFTTGTIYVISEILEEPTRVANSLVSAGETVLNFGRLAQKQAYLREAGTTRTWGSAIAMFDSIDSGSTTNGYDYSNWGAAVGVDHAFTKNTVVGVAFGCTWGENEPENGTDFYDAGSIDQDAKMIGIYGVHKFRTKGLMNDVKLSAFAAYGMFENDSTRNKLNGNGTADAEWDSDAWVLSASLSRDITTDSGVVFTPYVGVEYTKAGMDDFTESSDRSTADYTADEDYSNLSVKIGVSVSKTYGSFTPYANIAFISDVDRSAAKVTATGRETITGKSALPGRNGFEIGVGATWKLSENLDVNAGYSAEIRDKATEHNARVGIGYTF